MDRIFNAPCFVINMDRCHGRYEFASQNAKKAGWVDIRRFRGVDAKSDNLEVAWRMHGSPKFNPSDTEFVTYPGKQGCMLAHLNLWKHIIDNNIELATILEDDVCFHYDWHTLAPQYYSITPNYDILYLGSQLDYLIQGEVVRVPVFCTHAYVITLKGAKILYDLLLNDANGVSTIDCMLIDYMKKAVFQGAGAPFEWFAWSGLRFPDPTIQGHKEWAKRNTGLVFQDPAFGTDVRPW